MKPLKINKHHHIKNNKSIENSLLSKNGKNILTISLITALVFINVINNGFVDWDDYEYILNNPYLRDFSLTGITNIFTKSYFSNYHPLTTLTYLIEFQTFGLNPKVFHFTNYLLHIINTILVFVLFLQVSRNSKISFITALLFAVHPMHVESVAWISERKDLLYTAFYLSSLFYWTKYIKSDFLNKKYYLISFVLFLFSLMSKSAAVILPITMLLFNYFLLKKIVLKDIIKIIPYLLLSLTFGIIALLTQQEAISNLDITFSVFNRFFLVLYSISFYIIKFFAPYNFSTLHLYPTLENGFLPIIYYIAPVLILFLSAIIFLLKKDLKHIVVFGFMFFIINIILILQIIPVGNAVVSERYTYISYIGLSFILSEIFLQLSEKYNKNIIRIFGLIIISFLIVSTFKQNKVWKNDITLWTKAIESNPKNIIAYNKRGVAKAGVNDFNGAIKDYNKAISIDADFKDSYYNKANANREVGNFIEAINDYNNAIKINSNYVEAYNNRGLAKAANGDHYGAFADYDYAIKLKPVFAEAYNNKALLKVKLEDFIGAIADYDKAISLRPDYAQAYHNRGLPKYKLGDIEGAISDCSKAIELNPDYAETYNNRAFLKLTKGDKSSACQDWQKASKLGLKEANAMIKQYCK